MADTKAMLTKTAESRSPKPSRRVKVTAAELRFVSENQRMEGFSGVISPQTAAHQPDMGEIAQSAKRFNAQQPSLANRTPRPVITNFGGQNIR
jgi:hypothetical protein